MRVYNAGATHITGRNWRFSEREHRRGARRNTETEHHGVKTLACRDCRAYGVPLEDGRCATCAGLPADSRPVARTAGQRRYARAQEIRKGLYGVQNEESHRTDNPESPRKQPSARELLARAKSEVTPRTMDPARRGPQTPAGRKALAAVEARRTAAEQQRADQLARGLELVRAELARSRAASGQ